MKQQLQAGSLRSIKPDTNVRSTLAFQALVLFSATYFLRPEDFIPGVDIIPIGKITGGLALFALIFLVPSARRQKLPIELKVLLLLLAHMIICSDSGINEMKSQNVSCADAAWGYPLSDSIFTAWIRSGNFIASWMKNTGMLFPTRSKFPCWV